MWPTGRPLPSAFAATSAQQLEGLAFFLDVDRERESFGPVANGSVVVADRSWLTLVGHTYAVASCGGPSVYEDALKLVQRERTRILQPDGVLVLSVKPDVLLARTPTADRDKWFADPTYNRAFADFMISTAPSLLPGAVETIEGNADAKQVCRDVRAAIERRLAGEQ